MDLKDLEKSITEARLDINMMAAFTKEEFELINEKLDEIDSESAKLEKIFDDLMEKFESGEFGMGAAGGDGSYFQALASDDFKEREMQLLEGVRRILDLKNRQVNAVLKTQRRYNGLFFLSSLISIAAIIIVFTKG